MIDNKLKNITIYLIRKHIMQHRNLETSSLHIKEKHIKLILKVEKII